MNTPWIGSRCLQDVLPLGRLAAILFAIIAVAACSGGSDEATPTQAPTATQTDMPTASPSPAPSPTRTPKPKTPRPTQPPFNAIASALQLSGVTSAVGTRDSSLFCFVKPYEGRSHGDVYLVKGDATGLTAVGLVATSCGFSPDGRWLSTAQWVPRESPAAFFECFISAIQDGVLVETRNVGGCNSIGWVSDSQHFYMVTVSGTDASGFSIYAGHVESIDGAVYDWP